MNFVRKFEIYRANFRKFVSVGTSLINSVYSSMLTEYLVLFQICIGRTKFSLCEIELKDDTPAISR